MSLSDMRRYDDEAERHYSEQAARRGDRGIRMPLWQELMSLAALMLLLSSILHLILKEEPENLLQTCALGAYLLLSLSIACANGPRPGKSYAHAKPILSILFALISAWSLEPLIEPLILQQ